MFIFEREHKGGGAEREGNRGSKMGSALTTESQMLVSSPQTVRPQPELMLNQLRHQGAPLRLTFSTVHSHFGMRNDLTTVRMDVKKQIRRLCK